MNAFYGILQHRTKTTKLCQIQGPPQSENTPEFNIW